MKERFQMNLLLCLQLVVAEVVAGFGTWQDGEEVGTLVGTWVHLMIK